MSRHTRRVAFATPFVLVATACTPYKSGRNPPAPHHREMTAEQCQAIKASDACTGDESCSIPRWDGCGHVGWE